jgi:hypothetical protein
MPPRDAAAETRWNVTPSAPYDEERRRLYRASYTTEPDGMDGSLGPRAALGDGDADFLMGGLLRDGAAFRALFVDDPPSCVVASKTELGAQGRIVLTRVAVGGERLWTRELPLAETAWFGARAPALVFLGVEPGEQPAVARPLRVAAVDLRDGSLALASVGADD